MMTAKRLGLSVACLFLLAAARVHAQEQESVFGALGAIGRAKQYFDVINFYGKLPDLFGSFNTCLSRGYGYDRCHEVFNTCAFNNAPKGTIAGVFLDLYQFSEAFKVNCGSSRPHYLSIAEKLCFKLLAVAMQP